MRIEIICESPEPPADGALRPQKDKCQIRLLLFSSGMERHRRTDVRWRLNDTNLHTGVKGDDDTECDLTASLTPAAMAATQT